MKKALLSEAQYKAMLALFNECNECNEAFWDIRKEWLDLFFNRLYCKE